MHSVHKSVHKTSQTQDTMEATATIQHFAVDTAFITAIKRNSRALNTRILEEAHLKEFQEITAYYALPIPKDLALAYILD